MLVVFREDREKQGTATPYKNNPYLLMGDLSKKLPDKVIEHFPHLGSITAKSISII